MSSLPQERVEAPGAAEATRLLQAGARLVSVFGAVEGDGTKVRYVVDVPGPGYRVLEQAVRGPLQSLTPIAPAAAWYERELQDQFAVKLTGHPDPRRLLMPEDWEGFPLRKDFPVQIRRPAYASEALQVTEQEFRDNIQRDRLSRPGHEG
jgi:hypothetical protein